MLAAILPPASKCNRTFLSLLHRSLPALPCQVREFTETFAAVGLPASSPNMAYGLAEHTVGCSSFSPNIEGAALGSIADERLQSSGDVAYSLSLSVSVSGDHIMSKYSSKPARHRQTSPVAAEPPGQVTFVSPQPR